MPFGQKASTFKERVDWLVSHPDLWKKWYTNDKADYFILPAKEISLGRRNLFLAMQKDRLFSKRTYWLDVKLFHEIEMAKEILRKRT